MQINWGVRFSNPDFWKYFIPAVLLLAQKVAGLFGFQIDLGEIGNQIIEVVNSIFAVLVLLGIVNDPTTKGLSDSAQAMTYIEPKR